MTTVSLDPAPITHPAEGICQVRIPLPFALNSVNCYLIDDGDGFWTIMDTGLHRPEGEAVWQAAFRAVGITPAQIRRIILTHMHPDHFGMAGWLQQTARAAGADPPVLMSPIEREAARRTWMERDGRSDQLRIYMRQCGLPPEHFDPIIETGDVMARGTLPSPTGIDTLAAGEVIRLGGRTFRVLDAPGHCDGQILFFAEDERLLLSGDHVLMKITPNIGRWHDTEPNPLAKFLNSLNSLQTLDVALALPGHKAIITGWKSRIDELLAHHAERLSLALTAAENGATVYQVADRIFALDRLTIHELRFAVAEALAHLEYLENAGQLNRVEQDGVWQFSP
ncbi:MBL fold metallo-hydrolase [Anaerolineae bacterium CFX9]|nr:MBL fold metallo-hydrolase [Anaerolineae bacterium CFX9]